MNDNLYNTSFEVAMRILIIFKYCNRKLDLQKLIYYDYLILYWGEVDGLQTNVHPLNPYSHCELYTSRKFIQEALEVLIKKGLINIEYLSDGIFYSINNIGIGALSYCMSTYYEQLCNNAEIASKQLLNLSDGELLEIINSTQGKNDINKRVLLRGGYFEK